MQLLIKLNPDNHLFGGVSNMIGETLELMKKELRNMKVAENREEPFKKKESMTYYQEDTTYYVRNTDDIRSRKDNWKP